MSLEEHQQTDPEEQGPKEQDPEEQDPEAAGAPDTGNDLPTPANGQKDTPEGGEDFPGEHAPEDENNSTPEDAQDNSESGEVQEIGETGETEETGEKETNESDTAGTGELKIVLHLREGRTSAGVWKPGADVHLETFMETDMSILLAEITGLLERAQARWNENPLRPKYEPPKKAATKKAATKKVATKKAATKKTPTENQQNKTTPATETQQEMELQVEPEQQHGMARLF